MIAPITREYEIDDVLFSEALATIDRGGADHLIEQYWKDSRGVGGRPPSGLRYTIRAVLVAAMTLLMLGRTASIKRILGAIANFTESQLAAVGMAGADLSVVLVCWDREYRVFERWLSARLKPLDSGPDLPAKRITNAAHQAQLRDRTAEQRAASAIGLERARIVINRIVAGSIIDPRPEGCVGDVVADETIIRLANPSAGLGSRPSKNRGAAYLGSYHVQSRKKVDSTGATIIETHKAGFSVGVTALTRIGPRHALHSVTPVITAIDIHHPNAADVAGLAHALEHHSRNGFDCRRGGRHAWPLLTTDMGYISVDGFARLMLDRQYAHVSRYPQHWTKILPSSIPPGAPSGQQVPGPVQGHGDFYCPAATPKLKAALVHRTRDLLEVGGFLAHDRRLANLLPLLMGTNSRPKLARPTRGRPRLGDPEPDQVVKIDLVCPAVQGRCRCPLKPASLDAAPVDAPLVEPTWPATQYSCCEKSSTTVTLTDEQFKRAQFGLVPGSWEHATYYEAARALTEQRFSILKSQHVTGYQDLTWAPRREPMLKLIIALSVATANWSVQRSYANRTALSVESIDVRMRQLARDLGRDPTKTPPRT